MYYRFGFGDRLVSGLTSVDGAVAATAAAAAVVVVA